MESVKIDRTPDSYPAHGEILIDVGGIDMDGDARVLLTIEENDRQREICIGYPEAIEIGQRLIRMARPR